jgi:GT2 family glycosyltransferase
MTARVLISIVTHNSGIHLKACLESLQSQTFRDFSISIWDNASGDETPSIIKTHQDCIGFLYFSGRNLGFCEAHNRLIRSADSDYVLVLNPDVILRPAFLATMVEAMDGDSKAGSATGKLYRLTATRDPDHQASAGRILDTTGIYFTPNQRHFDRGSNEIDRGQYEKPEYVFGASGAAAFYRRTMLEDVCKDTEYFDASFFAYREDADLAWRALWMGWRCRYVPDAIAFHVRRVLPANRTTLPSIINMHSFKNRFLLRIKNMDAGTYMRFFIPITLRDLAALVYVVMKERSSLPGIPLMLRAAPHAWAWRKHIQSRKRATAREIRSWFSNTPVAKPASGAVADFAD